MRDFFCKIQQVTRITLCLFIFAMPEQAQALITNQNIIAWHEAGHAIATIYNDTAALVDCITIQPQLLQNAQGKTIHTQGHVRSLHTNDIHKSVEEFENHIISALAGPVAEQIAQLQSKLTNPHTILTFLAHPCYATDIFLARLYAQEIVTIQSFQYYTPQQIVQKIDLIIVRLYERTYAFLSAHTKELKKMAHILQQNQTISSDEAYDFMHKEKPAMTY